MEDLRLWFIGSRICRLWSNITEDYWQEFLAEDSRAKRKILVDFLETPTNQEIVYFTRFTSVEERQIEQEIDLDNASDSDSIRSPKMETVEVTKLTMSLEIPEHLHPHRMDLVAVTKIRPSKVPNPSTKKDGRQEM